MSDGKTNCATLLESEPLSDDAFFALREGFDHFVALQERRLQGQAPVVPKSAHSDSMFGHFNLLLDDSDFALSSIWEWFTMILTFGESEFGIKECNVGRSYLDWHYKYFFDTQRLTDANEMLHDPEAMEIEDWARTLETAAQLAFSSKFIESAELFHAILVGARVVTQFTGEEETVINQAIHLLVGGQQASTDNQRKNWQSQAAALLTDARVVLEPGNSNGNEIATALKGMLLDIVIIISRERKHTLTTAKMLNLDVLWYASCMVAFNVPSLSLPDLYEMIDASRHEFEDEEQWYLSIVIDMIRCVEIYDLLEPLQQLGRSVNASFEGSSQLTAKAMSALLADLCAPEFAAPANLIQYVFTRNHIMEEFVTFITPAPDCWMMAAKYMMYSPLADPQVIIAAIEASCVDIAQDDTLDSYNLAIDFLDQYMAKDSTFQRNLRNVVDKSTPLKFKEVFVAVDDAMHDLRSRLSECAFNTVLDKKNMVTAVSLALREESLRDNLYHFLRAKVRSDCLLEDIGMAELGEAIQSGILPVPAPRQHSNLRQLFQIIACVSDVYWVKHKQHIDGSVVVESVVNALRLDGNDFLGNDVQLEMMQIATKLPQFAALSTSDLMQASSSLAILKDSAARDELIAKVVAVITN